MERHTSKKVFAGILALSCAFVLGACDPVESLPTNYNTPILYDANENAVDATNNIMGKIYDSISGNKNEKVLELILNELATKKFGTYTEIKAAYDDAKKQTPDFTKANKYIEDHKEVFGDDNDEIKKQRFMIFAEDVMNKVSEEFYNLITSGSYNDENTGMFDEENLYIELAADLWDLQPATDVEFKKFYVTNELKKEEALSKLNASLYSDSENPRGYIEKNIFPKILKEKLIEQYIYENNYSALGRSYARSVNYIKVNYSNSTFDYVQHVLGEFTTRFIYTATGAEKLDFDIITNTMRGFDKLNTDATSTNGKTLLPYVSNSTYSSDYAVCKTINDNFVSKSIKGDLDSNKKAIGTVTVTGTTQDYTTIDGTLILDPTNMVVSADTELGELLLSYKKALKGKEHGFFATKEEQTEMQKFSSGKSYPDALREKLLALAKSDNTTDGWVVKNGGASDLPSDIKDRLFNLNVANNIENGFFKEEAGTYGNYRFVDNDPTKALLEVVPYARNINGRKLIMPASVIDWKLDNDNFIYASGSSFYITQVLEAPSYARLKADGDAPYKTTEGAVDTVRIEKIAREIAKVLSTKDSYSKNAYTHYLEEYVFTISDSSLYDYFKSQYPDLFDDED